MGRIIFGIIFIIGGVSGHLVLRGTNSSFALVIVGIIMLILGIVQMASGGEDSVQEVIVKEEECIVKREKIPVYSKAHESFSVIAELKTGDKMLIDFRSEYGRFYKVTLNNGEVGYILKESL